MIKEYSKLDFKQFILKSIKEYRDEVLCSNAIEAFPDDRDIVLEAVKNLDYPWEFFSYASDRLQEDKELVFEALKKDYRLFSDLSKKLKQDREFVSKLKKDIEGFRSYLGSHYGYTYDGYLYILS